jgi:hypothetical protein
MAETVHLPEFKTGNAAELFNDEGLVCPVDVSVVRGLDRDRTNPQAPQDFPFDSFCIKFSALRLL